MTKFSLAGRLQYLSQEHAGSQGLHDDGWRMDGHILNTANGFAFCASELRNQTGVDEGVLNAHEKHIFDKNIPKAQTRVFSD